MAGGASQLETFDYKPMLGQMHGKPMPESFTKGQQLAQLQGQQLICFGPQHPFEKFGANQVEICSLFPQIGSVIDDLCLIRSMTTEAINHDPAHMFMNTGSQIAGRPSMGAWITYGLGSESEDLPGFVVLTSLGAGGQNQPIAARQWSSGFLPSRYQGVQLRSQGDPVLYLSSPAGVSGEQQAADIRTIGQLNQQQALLVDDPEIATRIAQYEMAFQMQSSVPELMDIHTEDAKTLELYGCQPGDGSFAGNCLLAPTCRTRCAFHSALSQGLGPSQWHQRRHCAESAGDRPRLYGFDHRPETTRHAPGYPGGLGRGVRPDSHVTERRWARSPQ